MGEGRRKNTSEVEGRGVGEPQLAHWYELRSVQPH